MMKITSSNWMRNGQQEEDLSSFSPNSCESQDLSCWHQLTLEYISTMLYPEFKPLSISVESRCTVSFSKDSFEMKSFG